MLPDFRRVVQRLLRRVHRGRPRAAPEPGRPAPLPVKSPPDYKAAADRLVDMAVVQSLDYRRREHSVSRQGLQVDMAAFAVRFVAELKRRGMPFFVVSAFRGAAEQDALFASGVSRAKWGQSAHNFGCAVDIVHFGRYWDLTRKEWAVIGLIGYEVARKMNLKVQWGGEWEFYDPAHWQLKGWKDYAKAS